MAGSELIAAPCVLVHVSQAASSVDEYNDPTLTETTEPAFCELQQIEASEAHEGNVEESTWRAYLRPTTTRPTGGDRLEDVAGYEGDVFELLGDPNPCYRLRPSRQLHHWEATARRVTGAES